MKKIFLSFFILCITITLANAKGGFGGSRNNRYNDDEGKGHEIGLSFGPTFALTDLGGAKKIGSPFLRDVDFQSTRVNISVFYRYNINKIIAVRANIMWAMLQAKDANTDGTPPPSVANPTSTVSDSWYRARRNLSFKTHVAEFQALAELNLKKYRHDAYGKGEKERWAPYVGVGIGFFYFNPYVGGGLDGGPKIKLKPLGTEGQYIGYKKPYSNFQFDLMAVVGFKINVTKELSVGIEGMYHQTFTDYLDDVSGQYINPNDISKLSAQGQIFQNRTNTGPYSSNEFNYVEGQYVAGNIPNRILNVGGIGQQRGDKNDNDQFFNFNITLSYRFGDGGKKGAFGSCGRRNPYRHKFSCPRW